MAAFVALAFLANSTSASVFRNANLRFRLRLPDNEDGGIKAETESNWNSIFAAVRNFFVPELNVKAETETESTSRLRREQTHKSYKMRLNRM